MPTTACSQRRQQRLRGCRPAVTRRRTRSRLHAHARIAVGLAKVSQIADRGSTGAVRGGHPCGARHRWASASRPLQERGSEKRARESQRRRGAPMRPILSPERESARSADCAPGPGVLVLLPPVARSLMCSAVIPSSLHFSATSCAASIAAYGDDSSRSAFTFMPPGADEGRPQHRRRRQPICRTHR